MSQLCDMIYLNACASFCKGLLYATMFSFDNRATDIFLMNSGQLDRWQRPFLSKQV